MAALFDRYKAPVFGLAMSGLRDRDQALDVLSDVMFAVWGRAHTFEGRSSARSWILGIAVHKIQDLLRGRRRFVPEAHADAQSDAQTVSPADPRMVSERRALEGCLAKLSAAHRQVLHLAFFEDLSAAEISEALEVPPGTVRSRLHYAARVLRGCLQQRGVGA
jgi:RNA polymerase sigma-70 factor (ECF subfamily)